jgi:hypothetical protein
LVQYDFSAYDLSFSPNGEYFAYGSPYGELGVAYNPLYDLGVSVDMIPDNPPVVVPRGQSFTYTGVLSNTAYESQTVDVWVMLDVPDYGRYGPIQRFDNIAIPPFQTFTYNGV